MSIFFKRQAITSFLVAGLLAIVVVVAAVVFVQRRNELHLNSNENESLVAGEPLRFDDLNFRFSSPDPSWTRVEAKRIHPDAALAFASRRPEMAFVAIAEAPGVERQADLATLKEIILANYRSLWTKVDVRDSRAETLDGITGERTTVEVAADERKLTYVGWIGLHQGHTYQLQVFSKEAGAETLDRAADDLFARFSLLDRSRVAHSGKPIDDFRSPRNGYTLRLAGTRWQPWDNLAEVLPDAECGAMIGNYARCAVIPISLFGRQPRLEAVTSALLARLGIAFSASQARNFESLPGHAGHRFEMSREVAGRTYTYQFQVIEHCGRGYLVAAWADKAAPAGTAAQLADVLSRFQLQSSPPAAPASPHQLTLDQKQTHAQVFNDLGRYHFNARLFAESLDYFRQAFEVLENDPVVLDNVLNAHIELNQFREARDYLEKHLPRFSDRHDLKARYAFLQSKSGDAEEAIKTYAGLFAAGYRNDQAFQDYIELLADRNREDEALAQITQYLALSGASPAPIARRLQAMLYTRKGDHGRAISLLKELKKDGPFDVELAYDLAEAYLDAQQFQDGLAVCRELLEHRYNTPDTYSLKGRLELGLKWYAAAKTSFEASLRADPSNQSTQTYLDQVSGMLGEGNNSAVKDPIDAVPIPSELAALPAAEAADAFQKEYGACYLQRIEAIAFAPGTESKTTIRQVIKLFDASGVTRFSTFQLEFDPLAEQLYVNSLRVIDSIGKEIAFGKPSDYYVIDGDAGDAANQRKLLNVPVPGLQPGYTIELVHTKRDLSAPAHFPFAEHYFTAEVPILRDSVFVRGAADAVLARSSSGMSPRPVEGGMVWTVEEPPVYRHEPMQVPLEAFVPYVLLGSPAESWGELASDYLKSIEDRLEIEPSTRTLAEQTAGAAQSDEAKAAALTRLVRDQISYKAIEFGRRARVPNKGSTIVANRYGDCKDHALLVAQLLKASGVKAHLALVRTDGTPDEALPSLDQFDHMIVFVPNLGRGRFFDCTDKESSPDQTVPRGLAARPAFILDPANPRFVAVPAYPATSNLVHSERTLRLVNEADLAMEETLRLEGYVAATLRGLLKEVQPANRVAALQKQLAAGTDGSLQIQKVEIENLDDTSAPLVLKTDCLVKGRFHAVGDSLVGQIPALWERFFLSAERVENRRTPFVVRYPLRMKSAVSLRLPAGFTTGDMGPLNKEEQSSFAEWKMAAEEKGDVVRVGFEASRGVGQYAAEQYAAYCDSMERTVAALAQNVVLKQLPQPAEK